MKPPRSVSSLVFPVAASGPLSDNDAIRLESASDEAFAGRGSRIDEKVVPLSPIIVMLI